MKEKIVIIGAGLQGRMIADLLMDGVQSKEYEVAGFVDDDKELTGRLIEGIPVLGILSDLPHLITKHGIHAGIVGFSDIHMELRRMTFEKLKELHLNPINVIHPSAVISKKSEIGSGIFVTAGVIVNPFSIIGDNAVLYTGATIDHNNRIGNNVWVSPGVHLAGNVAVGDNTGIGIGAVVIPQVRIGRNVTIGAGAVVIKDVPDDAVVVGVPAKIIKYKTSTLQKARV